MPKPYPKEQLRKWGYTGKGDVPLNFLNMMARGEDIPDPPPSKAEECKARIARVEEAEKAASTAPEPVAPKPPPRPAPSSPRPPTAPPEA